MGYNVSRWRFFDGSLTTTVETITMIEGETNPDDPSGTNGRSACYDDHEGPPGARHGKRN